jgi:hypothetical protein
MENKYRLVQIQDDREVIKEYKTLKQIAEDLDVEIHLIRKINQLTEGRVSNIKPHHTHKELFEKIKIYNVYKTMIKL